MQINVCDIRRGLQHRAINEPTVTWLMESLPVSGQISPIPPAPWLHLSKLDRLELGMGPAWASSPRSDISPRATDCRHRPEPKGIR